MHVWDFFGEFAWALFDQLKQDNVRWGDTWLKRTRKGQEDRIFERLNEYYSDFKQNGTPIPWLKVVGEAMIGWIREQHQEYWPE